MTDLKKHRLYREAQNDYWEIRSRRARRILAFRKAARVALAILVAGVVLGGVVIHGEAGSIIHGVIRIARH